MANSLIDNTTYVGTDALGFYSQALLVGKTKEMVNVVTNVKSKTKIGRLDLEDILQADSCAFGASGDATLSQKTLEVCPIKVNLEFCVRDFEANYLSEQLRAGSTGAEVFPASFQEYLMGQIAESISAGTERLFWQGNTGASPADICDGLLTRFDDDADIITQAAVSGGITSGNVIAEIQKVYDLIPYTISNKGNAVIFISNKIAKAYKNALMASNSFFATYNSGTLDLNYGGVTLVIAPGLPDDVMVAAEPKNLWYGTDLTSDELEVKVLNMADTTGDPTARVIVHFKFGTNYGVSEEIVYYS